MLIIEGHFILIRKKLQSTPDLADLNLADILNSGLTQFLQAKKIQSKSFKNLGRNIRK